MNYNTKKKNSVNKWTQLELIWVTDLSSIWGGRFLFFLKKKFLLNFLVDIQIKLEEKKNVDEERKIIIKKWLPTSITLSIN